MPIEISGIRCRFAETPALAGIDLTIADGEFVALLGPSGSGKTTLLRIIAGLETADAGRLAIDGRDSLEIPPNLRQIGFVFQHYALFKHMTVARNIRFGLDVRPRRNRPPNAEIDRRVEELLELVQLPGLGRRYPTQLSGGQRQRVALARALAVEPRILLLDEPFGALDAKVRSELRVWLKALHRRLGLTSIFVTHDQEEAMEVADRIVVMRNGRIEQIGRPAELYAAPASAFVFTFLGAANRLPCRIENGTALSLSGRKLAKDIALSNGQADALFRPHDLALGTPAEGPSFPGTVADIAVVGPRTRVLLTHPDGAPITAELPSDDVVPLGLELGRDVVWSPRRVRVYPTEPGVN